MKWYVVIILSIVLVGCAGFNTSPSISTSPCGYYTISKNDIRSENGTYLGYSTSRSDGQTEYRAPDGKYLGYSNERNGRTEYRAPNGKFLGYSESND